MLYFEPGKPAGFMSGVIATKEHVIGIPVRELIQNGLDASIKAKNQSHEISLKLVDVPRNDDLYLTDYETVLNNAIKYHTDEGSFTGNSETRAAKLTKALTKQSHTILLCSDNGTGMDGTRLQKLLESNSCNVDEKSTGSFGRGSETAMWLSDLDFVFYYSYTEKGGGQFTGRTYIAGYKDDARRDGQGIIIKEKPKDVNLPEYQFHSEPPDYLKPYINLTKRGTTVVVLSLTDLWDLEYVKYCIASNFFKAITSGTLKVSITDKNTHLINQSTIKDILSGYKGRQRKKQNEQEIINGEVVWQCYETITKGETIESSGYDSLRISILNGEGFTPSVSLVRNGMLIANQKKMLSPDLKELTKERVFPFNVVLDIEYVEGCRLYKLLKGSENQYHNKLERKMLNNHEEYELIGHLAKITKTIKSKLPKINEESFVIKDFETYNATKLQRNRSRSATKRNILKVIDDVIPPRKVRQHNKFKVTKSETQRHLLNPVMTMRSEKMKTTTKLHIEMLLQDISRSDKITMQVAIAEDSDSSPLGDFCKLINPIVATLETNKIIKIQLNDKLDEVEIKNLLPNTQYTMALELRLPENKHILTKCAFYPIMNAYRRKS